MYSVMPNFILGFHGCDKRIFDKVIKNNEPLNASENTYDWLGNGIYFWEGNPQRANEFASEFQSRKGIEEIAVVGAIIDLGYCLNLTESKSLSIIKESYNTLNETFKLLGSKLPENVNIGSNKDLLLRNLDCAVIEAVHTFNSVTNNRNYDSVRGLFIEGHELYPNAGFREKNHIQVCVRNPNCIKGYFNPINAKPDYPIP